MKNTMPNRQIRYSAHLIKITNKYYVRVELRQYANSEVAITLITKLICLVRTEQSLWAKSVYHYVFYGIGSTVIAKHTK